MNEINILVPELPESIHYATIIKWHKKQNEYVQEDDILVDIETEKVILEVPSSTNGILTKILKLEGEKVTSKQILGYIKNITNSNNKNQIQDIEEKKSNKKNNTSQKINNIDIHYSPSQRRKNTQYNTFSSKNKHNNSFKENDIPDIKKTTPNLRQKKIIEMTFIRKKISERLLHTVQNTAMLTTFNEVNMQAIIDIRNKYCDIFKKKYNTRLGLMSFFIKAVIESLKKFPEVNSRIDNQNIIFYKYFDINVAISTKKGLLTPVLKDANLMSMSEIEKKIQYFVLSANEDKLVLSDLLSGTFTITNGGVFGSLLSTPIINPPQTAILGMHKIQDRVIVIDKKMIIAPMMYVSLSYDHRLIDGKEAIGFLKNTKDILEDFSRIVLDI